MGPVLQGLGIDNGLIGNGVILLFNTTPGRHREWEHFPEEQLRCLCLVLDCAGCNESPGPGEAGQGPSPGSSSCVTLGQSPTFSEPLKHSKMKRTEALEAGRTKPELWHSPWEALGMQYS